MATAIFGNYVVCEISPAMYRMSSAKYTASSTSASCLRNVFIASIFSESVLKMAATSDFKFSCDV